jgi:hypothetical protein
MTIETLVKAKVFVILMFARLDDLRWVAIFRVRRLFEMACKALARLWWPFISFPTPTYAIAGGA